MRTSDGQHVVCLGGGGGRSRAVAGTGFGHSPEPQPRSPPPLSPTHRTRAAEPAAAASAAPPRMLFATWLPGLLALYKEGSPVKLLSREADLKAAPHTLVEFFARGGCPCRIRFWRRDARQHQADCHMRAIFVRDDGGPLDCVCHILMASNVLVRIGNPSTNKDYWRIFLGIASHSE